MSKINYKITSSSLLPSSILNFDVPALLLWSFIALLIVVLDCFGLLLIEMLLHEEILALVDRHGFEFLLGKERCTNVEI
jgi:hypothetical protein